MYIFFFTVLKHFSPLGGAVVPCSSAKKKDFHGLYCKVVKKGKYGTIPLKGLKMKHHRPASIVSIGSIKCFFSSDMYLDK